MKADSIDRRLKDLEQKHSSPVEIELQWADPDEDSSKDGPGVIRLKWADELEKQY
jgi:hypothetical protein